jgi:hypothetical protein
VIPTWHGPVGWVLAWRIQGSYVAQPCPAWHELGQPDLPGLWYHEAPFASMSDLMDRLMATDSGDGPDWRRAELERVYRRASLASIASHR